MKSGGRASPWDARLYVIADLDFCGEFDAWLRLLGALDGLSGAAFVVQVRAKSLRGAPLRDAAEAARRTIASVPLVLNGSPRLAAALGYDGCHLPEAGLGSDAGRDSRRILSGAVHSLAAVRVAEASGADALLFSPVFAPTWKAARPGGLSALRDVAAETSLPVYALGGVTPANAAHCRAAGAHGVAVLSPICGAPDPCAATIEYIDALRG